MRRLSSLHDDRSGVRSTPGRVILAVCGAILVPFGFALALLPLRGVLEPAHVALVLTVSVVAVASVAGRLGAAVAAIAATVAFNLIHTEPYWTLRMSHRADVLTAAVLLGVGLVVGELGVRVRRARWDEAELRRDVEQLNEVAQSVASGHPPLLVVIEVSRALSRLLRLRESRFDIGTWWLIDAPAGRLDVDGAVIVEEGEWDADEHGFPDVEVELAVKCHGNVVGRYLLVPMPGNRIRVEHRKTAVVLAAHAGAAIVMGSA